MKEKLFDLINEEWKNMSLMLLLAAVIIYFMVTNETEAIKTSIIPMLAIGLNLVSKK